jgi:uncharacterized membrane protein
VKLSYLVKGLPGHPLHPPLTDATIGVYTFATVAALTDVFGWTDHIGAQAWWFALLVGLAFTALTATTGLLDWLTITWWTPLWKTATTHLLVMVTATVFFGLAAIFGHDQFLSGNLQADGLILTLIGFGLLTVGGWLGGAIVYVYGMRVLNLRDEPAGRAIAPVPHREKEQAAS